jgi:hypothetical protein
MNNGVSSHQREGLTLAKTSSCLEVIMITGPLADVPRPARTAAEPSRLGRPPR